MIGRRVLNLGSPVNRQSPLNRGLVSWWLAIPRTRGGTRFLDLCERNHGTLTNGPTWGGQSHLGGLGAIATVAASSQMVNCGTIANVNGTTTCSFCGWLYRSATTNTAGAGFSAGNSLPTGSANRLSVIWFSDGNLYFSGTANNAFGSCTLTGTGWHHVALVYDGGGAANADRVKMWVDGAQQTITFTGTTGTSLGTITPFTIGRDSGDRYTTGSFNDWRVFPQTVLTDATIKGVYNASRLGYHDELNWIRRPVIFDVGGAPPAGNRRRRLICGVAA